MKSVLRNKPIICWALYDWANSAFATTVIAGLFPVFYSRLTSELSTQDAHFWFNITLAVSSILIAIAAPFLGAIADQGGSRKKFLATFAMLGILMSAGLAWVGLGMWWVGLLVYGLGQIGFSGANIFYDALIVEVAPEGEIDMVSGFGYALGYLGGGILFLVNVLMITHPQWFGLPSVGVAVSWSFISVAIWWGVFTIPLLWVVVETPAKTSDSISNMIHAGLQQLRITYRDLKKLRAAALFLVGYWLYIDGVGTIFKMAVFFADRVLSLPSQSLITALLLTQFVAFPAAIFFGWLGKRIGPKFGILIGLGVYIAVVLYAWKWLDSGEDFYRVAVAIGLVQGGVQSLSRSLFARLVPRSKATEFFGFFNMVGKFASILGPLLMAITPFVFPSSDERDSILVLIPLFVLGGYFLWRVDISKGQQAAKDMDVELKRS